MLRFIHAISPSKPCKFSISGIFMLEVKFEGINPCWISCNIWMFPKNSGCSPQIIHFDRVFHYKPSILGGFPPIFGNTHIAAVLFFFETKNITHFEQSINSDDHRDHSHIQWTIHLQLLIFLANRSRMFWGGLSMVSPYFPPNLENLLGCPAGT